MTDKIPCGLPAKAVACKIHTAAPNPCVEEHCEQQIALVPYCPPCAEPPPLQICGLLEQGCDWRQSCEQSIPREIPCSPLVTGWGAYDGGVPLWARDGFCETGCAVDVRSALDPTRPHYTPNDWESFLDFNTHNEYNVRMTVVRNGHPARISPNEFIALTHKVMQLAHCFGLAVAPADVPKPAQFGLGLVTTGTDANGKPMYGLGMMYQGSAIGSPLAMVTERNAAGVVTGIRMPHELAVAQEAAG